MFLFLVSQLCGSSVWTPVNFRRLGTSLGKFFFPLRGKLDHSNQYRKFPDHCQECLVLLTKLQAKRPQKDFCCCRGGVFSTLGIKALACWAYFLLNCIWSSEKGPLMGTSRFWLEQHQSWVKNNNKRTYMFLVFLVCEELVSAILYQATFG